MDNIAERLANLSPEKRAIILRQLANSEDAVAPGDTEQGIVTGPVPILPAQRQLLTMLATYRLNYHHYNLSTMLEVARPLDAALLKQAVQHLLVHHDALRLRVRQDDSGWQQFISDPDDEIPFSVQDVSMIQEEEQKQAIEAAAAQLQTSLNITEGPILRVIYFHLGEQKTSRLLFILHHIASDTYSLQLVVEDFITAYRQLSDGKPIQLLPKTASIKRRAERMLEYARSSELQTTLDYWFSLPWAEVLPPPPDYPQGLTAAPQPRNLQVTLSKEETQALLRYGSRLGGVQTKDVLLAALAHVFARWNGSRTQLITTHNHGRKTPFEDVNLLRTVGWLAYHVDVVLQLPSLDVSAELVRSIAAQMERLPNDGLGYELLLGYESLSHAAQSVEVAAKFRNLEGSCIVFNYLGQQRTTDLFRTAEESVGPTTCFPNLWKSAVQMIITRVVNSELGISWDYSDNVYRASTVENLANQFLATLRALIKS